MLSMTMRMQFQLTLSLTLCRDMYRHAITRCTLFEVSVLGAIVYSVLLNSLR